MLKGLPLAYNKDMQEDKESVFDAFDTAAFCLSIFAKMIATMKVNRAAMYEAAQRGFINATDLADYLVKKGMPFRAAYKLVGKLVADCIAQGLVLESLPLAEYQARSSLFEADLYEAIKLETCVARRVSEGGTGAQSVRAQIAFLKQWLEETKEYTQEKGKDGSGCSTVH